MMKTRGRPFTRQGIELRRAIRTEAEVNPAATHQELRRKFGVLEPVVESAMTRTVAEWDTCREKAIEPAREEPATAKLPANPAPEEKMPGLEQGIVKFTRKPAKMGDDHILWIPRVYIKNGLVDPNAEYEVYLKRKAKSD
jgi:hypothetical protein